MPERMQSLVYRRQAEAFINQNPSSTIVSRAIVEQDDMGGQTVSVRSPLPPQTMRLVNLSRIGGQSITRTLPDGQVVTPEWILYGLPGADIRALDIAESEGLKLRVLYVHPHHNQGRVMAECQELQE